MGTRLENWSRIITEIENSEYTLSVTEIAKRVGMHHDTVLKILEDIEIIQKQIKKIKLLRTKNSVFVEVLN